MTQMKHLSIVDGAFLHMESAEMPMHVGSLNLFEPPAGYSGEGFYEAVKAHVAKRMHLAPVFTRKLALMPFDLANPVWIHDDDIDLDYHVRYMVLPKPGRVEQLEALAARLHSMLLDRSRPLWEFYVIEGLADGRIGFYGKVHHAAVDGQAGVAMATSMFDLTPEPRAVKPPRDARANTYQLGVAELLAAALQNQFQQLVQSARLLPRIASTALGAARDAIATRRAETGEDRAARKAEAPTTRFKLAPATPFNHSITNQRAFAAVSLPLPVPKLFFQPRPMSCRRAPSGSGPMYLLGSAAPWVLPNVWPPAISATVSSSFIAIRANVSRMSRAEASALGVPFGPSGFT